MVERDARAKQKTVVTMELGIGGIMLDYIADYIASGGKDECGDEQAGLDQPTQGRSLEEEGKEG